MDKDCFNCTYSHLYEDVLKCLKYEIEVDEDDVCEMWLETIN